MNRHSNTSKPSNHLAVSRNIAQVEILNANTNPLVPRQKVAPELQSIRQELKWLEIKKQTLFLNFINEIGNKENKIANSKKLA